MRLSVLAIVLASSPLVAAQATAADLLPPLPEIHHPAPAEAIGGGWYLRGDIGYAHHPRPRARAVTPAGTFASTGEKLSDAVVLGAGVGYRVNSWLRADLTVDHRFAASATLFDDPRVLPGFALTGRFASTTALANAYLDLGTWSGITPYVGAGLGYSWNNVSGLRVGGVDAAARDRTVGSLAWALMAGVAVDAGHGFAIDLGYRYLDLGRARTAGTPDGYGEVRRLSAHEARVGLRWSLDQSTARVQPISRAF